MGLDYALAQARANPARGETGRRFDFSYNPLPEPQKELLHRLAAFAAGFDLQAIGAVCSSTTEEELPSPRRGGAGGGVLHWDADLPELVRGSFVERHTLGPDYARFRLHPVMREYLRRKAGAKTMAAHDRRFARYFTALADWGGRQLGDPETALQAVAMATLERANLLAAQETYLAQGLWDEAVSLAYRLGGLFERIGHWADRRRALEVGIEAAQKGEKRQDKAGLTHNLGILAQQQGDYDEARRLYQQVLNIEQQLSDHASLAQTLHNLGALAQDQGDYDEARHLYRQSLDVKQQLGDRTGVAQTLHQMGNVAYLQGDYAEARRLYQQAAETFEQLGAHRELTSTLHQLGMLAQDQGNYAEARRLYHESLDITQQLSDRSGAAKTLHNLGTLAQVQERYAEALRLYQESLEIKQQIGDKTGITATLSQMGKLGRLLVQRGRWRRAVDVFKQKKHYYEQLDDRAGLSRSLLGLAQSRHKLGSFEQARWTYKDALHQFRSLGQKQAVAIALTYLGQLELQTGLAKDAIEHLTEAREYFASSDKSEQCAQVQELLEAAENLARSQENAEDWGRRLIRTTK
jgi:tetratricopeptide (TPR) repeat protein